MALGLGRTLAAGEVRVVVVLLVLSASFACGNEGTPANKRRPSASSTPVGEATGAARSWDDGLGTAIATPSAESGMPVVFLRDSANAADIEVELFSHEGRTTPAILKVREHRRSCAWERNGMLGESAGGELASAWSLALTPGTGTPVSIDAVSDLLPRDSATLVAQIHRQVSAIADDSVSGPFRGLPIVVRDAFFFRLVDSSRVVVAVATRSLNVESNPSLEITTVIMEESPEPGGNEWRTGFAHRAAGPEDRVVGADLLAVFRLKSGRMAVALATQEDRNLQLDVIERTAPGKWHVRWSTSGLPCSR